MLHWPWTPSFFGLWLSHELFPGWFHIPVEVTHWLQGTLWCHQIWWCLWREKCLLFSCLNPQNNLKPGWWFGTFFIFPCVLGNNHPNWRTHIFQRLKPPGRNTIPCKTQHFIHQQCSIQVSKSFKDTGGAPQNEAGIVFALGKRRLFEKKSTKTCAPNASEAFFCTACLVSGSLPVAVTNLLLIDIMSCPWDPALLSSTRSIFIWNLSQSCCHLSRIVTDKLLHKLMYSGCFRNPGLYNQGLKLQTCGFCSFAVVLACPCATGDLGNIRWVHPHHSNFLRLTSQIITLCVYMCDMFASHPRRIETAC